MALQGNFATAIGDLRELPIKLINEAIFQSTFGVGSFTGSQPNHGVRNGKLTIVLTTIFTACQ